LLKSDFSKSHLLNGPNPKHTTADLRLKAKGEGPTLAIVGPGIKENKIKKNRSGK
jgi:hypothetical protein